MTLYSSLYISSTSTSSLSTTSSTYILCILFKSIINNQFIRSRIFKNVAIIHSTLGFKVKKESSLLCLCDYIDYGRIDLFIYHFDRYYTNAQSFFDDKSFLSHIIYRMIEKDSFSTFKYMVQVLRNRNSIGSITTTTTNNNINNINNINNSVGDSNRLDLGRMNSTISSEFLEFILESDDITIDSNSIEIILKSAIESGDADLLVATLARFTPLQKSLLISSTSNSPTSPQLFTEQTTKKMFDSILKNNNNNNNKNINNINHNNNNNNNNNDIDNIDIIIIVGLKKKIKIFLGLLEFIMTPSNFKSIFKWATKFNNKDIVRALIEFNLEKDGSGGGGIILLPEINSPLWIQDMDKCPYGVDNYDMHKLYIHFSYKMEMNQSQHSVEFLEYMYASGSDLEDKIKRLNYVGSLSSYLSLGNLNCASFILHLLLSNPAFAKGWNKEDILQINPDILSPELIHQLLACDKTIINCKFHNIIRNILDWIHLIPSSQTNNNNINNNNNNLSSVVADYYSIEQKYQFFQEFLEDSLKHPEIDASLFGGMRAAFKIGDKRSLEMLMNHYSKINLKNISGGGGPSLKFDVSDLYSRNVINHKNNITTTTTMTTTTITNILECVYYIVNYQPNCEFFVSYACAGKRFHSELASLILGGRVPVDLLSQPTINYYHLGLLYHLVENGSLDDIKSLVDKHRFEDYLSDYVYSHNHILSPGTVSSIAISRVFNRIKDQTNGFTIPWKSLVSGGGLDDQQQSPSIQLESIEMLDYFIGMGKGGNNDALSRGYGRCRQSETSHTPLGKIVGRVQHVHIPTSRRYQDTVRH
ncbi:hypothetical protein DFA_10296 [Cavenderia fasciculata]|uniref:Ankyrin repeat-containing protein n=1 Tax=Cavenderia fasciculata TaxID=261658 RepID=F4Q9T8_CACFS|nr:uncharacterized protein DFA_10296 [Cavenderia fasciculata]EGG15457.1 hypothetical protein DFA_10296 [Cavenderia fasciculata]|eukprot:XP_004354199.1 hypothetical protein DFA_10296 [Cavenderia fasciculata]